MILRSPIPADAGALTELLTQLGYPERKKDFITRKIERHEQESYRLLVAEINSQVVGFISMHWFDMFHSDGLMGRITAVCVNEDTRSSGVGKQLLIAAEQFLFLKGCSHVEVTCNLRRTRTHEFYRNNGYAEDSKRFIKKLSVTGPSLLPPLA